MLTLEQLQEYATFVYESLDTHTKVKVCIFQPGHPYSRCAHGLHTTNADGSRNVWLNLERRNGTAYADRFVLSVLGHELAHFWSEGHGKDFKKAQKRVRLVMRQYEKASLLPLQKTHTYC